MSSRFNQLPEVEQNLKQVQSRKRKRRQLKSWVKTILEFGSLFLLVLFVFNFILGIARVNQNSMLPNIQPNDVIVYNRLDHNFQYNDVVVALEVNDNVLIIKRIIGLPGDTINIDDSGTLTVNGHSVQEKFLTLGQNVIRDVSFPVTLDENEYFLIGDNRSVSLDSRSLSIGNIKKANIYGKVFYVFRGLK